MIQNSDEVRISGTDEEIGLRGSPITYIFAGNPVHQLLKRAIAEINSGELHPGGYAFQLIVANVLLSDVLSGPAESRARAIEVTGQLMSQQLRTEIHLSEELRALIAAPPPQLFDPLRGDRARSLGYYEAEED